MIGKWMSILLSVATFLAPSFAAPPQNRSAFVTSPEAALGFPVGADYRLADYDQALAYFQTLDQQSPRLKLESMGRTGMDRDMMVAIISSEENMRRLERYREISRRLALTEGLSDDSARSLAAEGRAVVWIDVGIHATECAPAQHALQLAYDLVIGEDAETRLILDNTILVLVFANPDGMQMVAEWYRGQLGTPFETSSMPWLYNRYVGHDNNRDSYMNNLVETRNITRLLNRTWYPVVLYDHHQTAPFPARIWIPPAAEPTNPNLHPLFIRGKNLIGSAMGYAFDREGKPGAISRFAFDFIYPGYEDSFGDFFHIISIMTETALYRYATPRFYTVSDFPESYRDFMPSVFYPSPWKGGWWRLRDAVEYCLTASRSVLHTAALYREWFLYGKYRMGRDIVERFSSEPPYAWIIPREQWDGPTAALLVNRMLLQGIRVEQAEQAFECDGRTHPAGTWVIPMNQPFALFVKAVFEEQRYPDLTKHPTQWQGVVRPQHLSGVDLPPYDMAGWTLPDQMGVRVLPALSPVEADLIPIEKAEPIGAGRIAAGGGAYLISPRMNNGYAAINRILKNGGRVSRANQSFVERGVTWPAGTAIVASGSVSRNEMGRLARDLSLEIGSLNNPGRVAADRIAAPRIALYRSWRASMDEGWTRWLLETYDFPFDGIGDAEIRSGALEKHCDVLILPSMSSGAILKGHAPGTMPARYTGGIGAVGVRRIRRFVESGGRLVAINAGCRFAIENLGLPVRDVIGEARGASGSRREGGTPEFSCPGSILNMIFDSRHPVAYGMPDSGPALFYRSPAFRVFPGEGKGRVRVIARYPEKDLLRSGWLTGEKVLSSRSSALEVALGKGSVILLGFGVQNRAQTYGTFRMLFNAILSAGRE